MARLFVAMLIPPEVGAHLDERLDAVRTAFPELRWVRSAHWHLTLEFLGECGRHETDRQLGRWERRARRSSPMTLWLASGGAFPRVSHGRVLWTGLAGDVEPWKRLAGYAQEPHVTLARSRTAADLGGPVAALSDYQGPDWAVSEIALVESHLRGPRERGPRYEPLEVFPLGA